MDQQVLRGVRPGHGKCYKITTKELQRTRTTWRRLGTEETPLPNGKAHEENGEQEAHKEVEEECGEEEGMEQEGDGEEEDGDEGEEAEAAPGNRHLKMMKMT